MKITKKILSLLMALVIFVSVALSVELSAFASDEVTTPTETETQVQTEIATDAPADPTVDTTEGETQFPSEDEKNPPIVDETKVGKVGKLYKDSRSADSIEFYWNEVEGADGYRIYYKNNDVDDDYRFLVATTGTRATLKDLPHTTPFQFKVAAFVIEDGVIYEGLSQVGKTATQPAKTPTPTLKSSASTIKISWSKNSKADGYRIYRQDAKTNGKLVLYKTIKKNTTTTFEDKKVSKGRAYNYQVRAYRKMYEGKTYIGDGSTLRTVCGLATPKLASCTSQLRRVTIDWNNNSVAKGYDIYYKADDRSSYKLLKTTSSSYINTKHLRAGHTYNFRIRPYKLVGKNKTKVYGTYLSVTKKATSAAYGKKIGKTYIEISLKQQHMWYYIDGKCYVSTPVVTGNVGAYATPTGAYKVWQRMSPATLSGPTWCTTVKYWLAFTYSGCGIHDASWRSASEFGGTTYMGNGSHGCVNTPNSAVKKIYQKAKIGTHVIVY